MLNVFFVMETSPNTAVNTEIAEYFSHEELTAQIPKLKTLITEDNAPADNLFFCKTVTPFRRKITRKCFAVKSFRTYIYCRYKRRHFSYSKKYATRTGCVSQHGY